jgi:hypothetical protein
MKQAFQFLSSTLAVAAVLSTSAVLLPSPVAAQVYRCDSESGVPVYQGSPSGMNCRPIDMTPLTTIPAPQLPPAASRPAGSSAGQQGAGQSNGQGSAGQGSARPAATPPQVPRVDARTQRTREGERRSILETELAREEGRLDSLRREYKDGEPDRLGSERNYQKYLDRVERLKDDIARAEANIGSLKRELAAIRE